MTVASLAPVFVGLQDPWMPRYVQRITGSTINVVDLYGVDESMAIDSPIGCDEPHPDVINSARMECEIRNQINDNKYRAIIDEYLNDMFQYHGDDIPFIMSIVWQFTSSHGQLYVFDQNGNPVTDVPSQAASDMMAVYVQARIVQRWTILRMSYM